MRGEIKMGEDSFDRNVWDILHRLHDYDLEDIEKDLARLERMINEDVLHNFCNWMTQLRKILMGMQMNKIKDIKIMREYNKILRSLGTHEYMIVSRAIVRLMGNRTRMLLEDPELYQRLRKGYLQAKENKK
jgi:hypothetical protein